MESLYKAGSSLIEHKRFRSSGTPDEAFMKYMYIYNGSWIWVNVVLLPKTAVLFSELFACLFSCFELTFLLTLFSAGSAPHTSFSSTKPNISLIEPVFSLHVYVGVFFIHVMFTVKELPLKSISGERSLVTSKTLHIQFFSVT